MDEIIVHIVQPTSWIDIATLLLSPALSIIAIVISIKTYRSQREHDINSVHPILNVVLGDYENKLYVRVENNGVGPAIITDINCDCEYLGKEQSGKSLIELMPYEAVIHEKGKETIVEMNLFSDFVGDISGRTIPPGGRITLLHITEPKKDQLLVFRNLLSKCTVNIKYSDIYNSKPWTYKRKLNFFARNVIPNSIEIYYHY